MQWNDHWSIYQSINDVINLLIDEKLEHYKKDFLNFLKSLKHIKCNWITVEVVT